MKYIFSPGCALILYKPHLVEKIHDFLNSKFGQMELFLTCCRHASKIPENTKIINICAGCDKRYREKFSDVDTISLWEILSENEEFDFPDYKSAKMTIIDACPTRDQDRIHASVRDLLKKMNISVIEPDNTKRNSTCCGDSFYGNLPTEQVKLQMQKKANQLPIEDVVVYCVSCSKSMFIGGKCPRYLVDILFNEETLPGTFDIDEWHQQLDKFIDAHQHYQVQLGL